MNHQLVIINKEDAARACEIIRLLPHAEPHDVTIKPHKRNRSVSQNALMWQWLTIIAMELGETKEDIHERYKGQFLVPIYERDDTEYAAMIEAVREVWRQGMKKEADVMRRKIIALTSTTAATVDQFTEYLTDIERHAESIGIYLPTSIHYNDAMGR